jgi:signal peptidase I
MLLFRSAIADWNQVPSGSMIPSILVGDRIVVDKLAYDLRIPFTLTRIARWHEPQRGDVVTFPSPKDERLFVKRIVGLPGDTVELRSNHLTINGETANYARLSEAEVGELNVENKQRYLFLRETLLDSARIIMLYRHSAPGYDSFGPIEVPADHYLVLGDNRDNSGDFRRIGFVGRDRILGRARAIAFSLDYQNYYAPRMDRFFETLP